MAVVTFFSGNELVEIAVGIERNGYAFYQSLEQRTCNEAARAIYGHLAREERRHESTFLKLGATLPRLEVPEAYPGEQMLYMKSLIDSLVFHDAEQAVAAAHLETEIAAVSTGIQAEKDSILFYGQMAQMVREADRDTLLHIVDEEKEHLRRLAGLKSTMAQKSSE
jgi:rubrerythrin